MAASANTIDFRYAGFFLRDDRKADLKQLLFVCAAGDREVVAAGCGATAAPSAAGGKGGREGHIHGGSPNSFQRHPA
jgi:hypothetical protein